MQMSRNHTVFVAMGLALSLMGACDSGRHGRAPEGEQAGEEGEKQARTLTIKGSDTMVILAQRWAERFMKKNPKASVQVSGGGSGTGIAALINGTTDIANASREMKPSERETLKEKRGAEARQTSVALDAVAVYVHEDNPIESLTLPQLEKIYRGKVESWKEVGGPDQSITLYGRENNSGTYVYFKENVLNDLDFARETQTLPGTAAVINAVAKDEGGIGYGGIGYAEGVRTIPLAKEGEGPVEPTLENATSGAYPLSRHLYIYTAGDPEGVTADYVAFVLSPDGQNVVEGAGYYPLPEEKAAEGDTAGKQLDDGDDEATDEDEGPEG